MNVSTLYPLRLEDGVFSFNSSLSDHVFLFSIDEEAERWEG